MGTREFYEHLPSTQSVALERARSGCPGGTRVVAARQTRGIGRLDHAWESPLGGLYLSVVVAAPERPALLPLGVGSCLRDRLKQSFDLEVRIKWPNDLYGTANGRWGKLGGVLLDQVGSPTLGRACVVGVGVNVRRPPSGRSPVLDRATYLDDLLPEPPSLEGMEEGVVESIQHARELLRTASGEAALLRSIRAGLLGVGRHARNDEGVEGVIRDVEEDGALRLDAADGVRYVRSGSLELEDLA